jgi:hypothetical protein
VLDRASTFADAEIVNMLQTRFVPVAIDQAYQRRQQDTEGDFYRKIAAQSPRDDFQNTTQGFYVATADGDLLFYNNNRDPAKLRRLLNDALQRFSQVASPATAVAQQYQTRDPRYNVSPPEGGLVVRVRAKVLDGYAPTNDRWKTIFQNALSRDNLWITKPEHESLARGEFPVTLQRRLARFHLVDNTRGEPPMWREGEIRSLEIRLDGRAVTGAVHLETERGDRGYRAEIRGLVEVAGNRVTRFDLVALGQFWGEGRYTRGAPEGEFPLAVSLTLADGTDVADLIPPQGSRGWLQGYLR